jgi:hypothetical protein
MDQVYRCGPRGRGAPKSSLDLRPRFNENERVCNLLISTVQSGMGILDRAAALGGGQRDARGGARGSSLELSLAFAPVAPSRRVLHLCGLQRTGVLITIFTDVGGLEHRLAMRRRTQRMSVRSRGLVVLLRLRFFSQRLRWWLLFLRDQVREARAQRDCAATRAGRGCKVLSWGKGQDG